MANLRLEEVKQTTKKLFRKAAKHEEKGKNRRALRYREEAFKLISTFVRQNQST